VAVIDYLIFALKALLGLIAIFFVYFVVEFILSPIKFFKVNLSLLHYLFGEDGEFKFSKRVFWRGLILIFITWLLILLFIWYKFGFP